MRLHEVIDLSQNLFVQVYENRTDRAWTLYHGTDSQGFDTFDPRKADKEIKLWNPLGQGMYVTNSKELARYFGINTYEVSIPTGSTYKKISADEWLRLGRSLATKALLTTLKTAKEAGVRADVETFKIRLPTTLLNQSPRDGLSGSFFLVQEIFGRKIADAYRTSLPSIATQAFRRYDLIVFTSTTDDGELNVVGQNGKVEAANEILILNPALQKTVRLVARRGE